LTIQKLLFGMPVLSKPSSSRNIVSIDAKYEALNALHNKTKSRLQVCLELKIASSTLANWVKLKEKILN
jgi:hypothetical protein